jgi:hypothetical protein
MKWATTLGLATLMAAMVNPAAARPTPKLDSPDWRCGDTQHKEFDTYLKNLNLDVQLCVQRLSDGHVQARANIYWRGGGGLDAAGMQDLTLELRVEQHDKIKYKESFDLKSMTNDEGSGSFPAVTKSFAAKSKGGWTADAIVKWDINSDGKKGGTWKLHGSPVWK